MPELLLNNPVYRGVKGYRDDKGGFEIWLPSDWVQVKLKGNHKGWLFSPYKDDYNTCLLVEKKKLKYAVKSDDIPTLLESFHEGMNALPGVEVESTEESLSETINVFDARFSFLEGEERRKRWVRNIYWGDGQLIVIAQGRTVEDFQLWLPMFYNTMTTLNII